jgi:hypothetical protein
MARVLFKKTGNDKKSDFNTITNDKLHKKVLIYAFYQTEIPGNLLKWLFLYFKQGK